MHSVIIRKPCAAKFLLYRIRLLFRSDKYFFADVKVDPVRQLLILRPFFQKLRVYQRSDIPYPFRRIDLILPLDLDVIQLPFLRLCQRVKRTEWVLIREMVYCVRTTLYLQIVDACQDPEYMLTRRNVFQRHGHEYIT